MKILLIVFCLLTIVNFCAFAQTGFFLIVDNKRSCPHLVISVDEKQKYCITEEPIIKESEFKSEGKLQYDLIQKNQFFNIRFTKSGFETIKLICERLPEKQLVLVVNGKAAGTYQNKDFKPALLMPISGTADSKEIKWVYDNLKNHN